MTYEEMEILQKQYRSLRFRRKYTYTGADLGVTCCSRRTEFALWAPLAKSVTLRLFRDSETETAFRELPMKRTDQGVWRWREGVSLHGTYYDYLIDHGKGPIPAGDPWARACGCNSRRCMVVDLTLTDPQGWEQDAPPARESEDIIYELHIKEFSWQEAGGFPPRYRGKYMAFTCPDTTLHNDGIHPTGLPYLRQLGVNTLQIMPFFDYGSVDEADPDAFNWGYDPVYYNIPEGSYATDPRDGTLRILECKKMIQALHKNGFRVVMDVVYNHTYSLDSPMNRTVPGYFYRHDNLGHATNGSLCGNELASERPMCGKFILDSVLYWAEQYHIDGFRFDLMGLLDVDLMNRIRRELDLRYGAGEKLLYGEPWAAGASGMERRAIPATKANVGLLDPEIGMFSDNTRDTVKGHVFFRGQPGFITGAQNLEYALLGAIQGWCGRIPGISAPSQIIAFLSCHDNLTLYDKLKASAARGEDLLALNRLAAAILFTCQGRPFLLSGEEFARTKDGNDNSYNAPIALNRLDWERAWEQEALRDYYRGLIAFRKQCPGLCEKTPTDRVLSHWVQAHVLGCYLDNTGHQEAGMLCMIYNAGLEPVTHSLCPGDWALCVDGENSFLWQDPEILRDRVTVPPISAVILRKRG